MIHRWTKRCFWLASCAAAIGAIATMMPSDPLAANAQDKAEQNRQKITDVPRPNADRPMSFWMSKKLDFSKSILESLARGDFEKLADDAEQMRLIGRIEGFVRRQNDDYRAQQKAFEHATVELIRQSKRKNAEGAGLAFNQLTTSCVACHVLLREEPN